MRSLGCVARGVSGRTWKLIGLAGLAGVTATGVVLARNERRRRAFTPDEVRARLHQRHAEVLAVPPLTLVPPPASAATATEAAGAEPVATVPDRRPPALGDPERIARAETEAWVGYYRREWRRALRGALVMVREAFGTTPLQTALGGWYLLRATQAWAPYPDNDPDTARALMERFYRTVAAARGWSVDPREAARLEVAWWAVHRELQHDSPGQDDEALVAALAELYAYVHSRPARVMVPAARYRADAMRLSDAWVRDGCRPDDPRLRAEEARLVLSYACLRDAVLRA
jgi:hypothetical protein